MTGRVQGVRKFQEISAEEMLKIWVFQNTVNDPLVAHSTVAIISLTLSDKCYSYKEGGG